MPQLGWSETRIRATGSDGKVVKPIRVEIMVLRKRVDGWRIIPVP